MTDPDTISADYSIRPAELAEALSLLARSRQPVIVWSPPGCGKSQIAQQVAQQDGYRYVDIRALLLDPVDLRGIPWRDEHGRTRWAPPSFLPPTDSTARWLLNLEELASCVPMPNRRFIDGGLYLPSMRTEGMGTLAVIIDTSGSVDTDVLAAFWSEVREVAAEIEPECVIVLQVDAAVQDEQNYAPGELPERIVVKGRWGTDFRPGFARLAERGERPACCLYFTDMDCDSYPESEPAFPVLWCDWSGGLGLPQQPPPWGEHIRIGD